MGYCLRGHRIKTPYSEIDLLLENEKEFILVEVKTFSNNDFEAFRLSYKQIQRLKDARSYLEIIFGKDVILEYASIESSGKISTQEILF